jgi:hypothetical protein
MKIKTPLLNVDNTETKIDGGIDFIFDSNIQSSVNVPMIKVQMPCLLKYYYHLHQYQSM